MIAADALRAPDLHAGVGGRAAPAARAERRHARLRRAPTTAGASTRTAAPPGCARRRRWAWRGDPGRAWSRGRDAATATHGACALRRRGRATSAGSALRPRLPPPHLPVAGRPRRPAAAAALAAAVRPLRARATTSATRAARSGRTSTRSSPPRASTCSGGRVLMLANARVLGYVFNPLTRLLVPPARRVARVRRRRGAQHLRRAALLPAAHRRRRAGPRPTKDFYVSPFLDRRRRATGCGCRSPASGWPSR